MSRTICVPSETVKTISLPHIVRWLQTIDFPKKLGIMEWLFGRELASHGICWAQTTAGIPWKLDLRNCTHRWIVCGIYEGPGFFRWAKNVLPANGIVVDSGANIGQWLLYLAGLVPQGKVLAFEPGSKQADWLEECLLANPKLRVELIRLGLGAAQSELCLHDGGDSTVHGAQSTISTMDGERVLVRRLDDELGMRGITQVDLWVLDVEGYEIPALEGAGSYLQDQQIRAVYVELCGENGCRIIDFLSRIGYAGFLLSNRGKLMPMRHLPNHANALFLPANHRQE